MNQNEINQNEEVTKGRNIKLWIVLAILSLCAVFFAIFLWGDKAENHAYANQEAEFEVAANHVRIESMETEATSNIVEETSIETTAPQNPEEPKFVTEFEITDWTMEELVENFYLCGQKIVLPLHSNELCDGFDLTNIGYSSKLNQNMFALSYNGHDVAIISCNDYCSDDTDFVINNIQYDIIQQNPQINIMGITELSTPDEVKKILGEPNYIQDDGTTYRYIFSDKKQLMLSFNKDYNGIDFYHISYEEE